MSDILTMVWKELKDVLFQGGWRSLIRPLIVIGIMGIYLPLQLGSQWLDLTPLGMLLLLWIPFFVIISFIGDAIAGERERHTLETLLASRMPDRAILLGKVVAIVLYAWGMGVISLLTGPGVSQPVSYSGELDVLSSRSVRGCSRLNPASQRACGKRGRAGIAESSDGAAGTANSERRHDSVCIRDRLCTESRTCECYLIVKLFAVFAHCNGGYCRAGCDLAWIITGELPTFALNLELRKHVEINYYYYPQGW